MVASRRRLRHIGVRGVKIQTLPILVRQNFSEAFLFKLCLWPEAGGEDNWNKVIDKEAD